jgi:hypothetical protein
MVEAVAVEGAAPMTSARVQLFHRFAAAHGPGLARLPWPVVMGRFVAWLRRCAPAQLLHAAESEERELMERAGWTMVWEQGPEGRPARFWARIASQGGAAPPGGPPAAVWRYN